MDVGYDCIRKMGFLIVAFCSAVHYFLEITVQISKVETFVKCLPARVASSMQGPQGVWDKVCFSTPSI